jgi:hypothetical protein
MNMRSQSRGSKKFFYAVGLGAETVDYGDADKGVPDGKWSMTTLEDFMHKMGHDRVDVLKFGKHNFASF